MGDLRFGCTVQKEGEDAYPANTPACIGFRVSGEGGSLFFGSVIYPNLAHGARQNWDALEFGGFSNLQSKP